MKTNPYDGPKSDDSSEPFQELAPPRRRLLLVAIWVLGALLPIFAYILAGILGHPPWFVADGGEGSKEFKRLHPFPSGFLSVSWQISLIIMPVAIFCSRNTLARTVGLSLLSIVVVFVSMCTGVLMLFFF